MESLPQFESIEPVRVALRESVGELAQKARWLAVRQALLSWLAVVLGTVLVLVAIDWLLRREEYGLRVLELAALLAVAAWFAYRWLLPLRTFYPSPMEVATWIESHRPELRELPTAVAFAYGDAQSTRMGSPSFQAAVLRGWEGRLATIDWLGQLDHRNYWRATTLFGCLALTMLGVAVFLPTESAIGLRRLLLPLSSAPWPREDQLEFLDLPNVVAVGSDLQLEVVDKESPLPEEVFVAVKTESGEIQEMACKLVGDSAIATLPNIQGSIEVRAYGGDDRTMLWRRVEAVAAPKFRAYEFLVEPPDYTRRKPQSIVGQRIQVLAGSRVQFQAELQDPVDAVEVVDGELNDCDSQISPWQVRISNGGVAFSLTGSKSEAFRTLDCSQEWTLAMTTSAGLKVTDPTPWRVDVVRDSPPRIQLQASTMQQVSEDPIIAVEGTASDDLGIVSIELKARVAGAQEATAITENVWLSDEFSESVPFNKDWRVAESLAAAGIALNAGDKIEVWAEARDTLGQVTSSSIENYTVRSQQELVDFLARQQTKASEKLREVVNLQQMNTEKSQQVENHLETTSALESDDQRMLADIMRRELQIANKLAGDTDSLTQLLDQMQSHASNNGLGNHRLAKDIADAARLLREVAANELREATAAAHAASDMARRNTASDALIDAVTKSAQSHAIARDALTRVLQDFDRSGSVQQLRSSLGQIATEQDDIRQRTEQQQIESLNPSESNSLEVARGSLADEQSGLARRLDELVSSIQRFSSGSQGETNSSSEDELQLLADAAESVLQQQVAVVMRQAAEDLRQNNFADGIDAQAQVAKILSQVLDGMGESLTQSSSSSSDASALLQQLSETLSSIARSQSDLGKDLAADKAANELNSLVERQQQLRRLVERELQRNTEAASRETGRDLAEVTETQKEVQQAANNKDFAKASQLAEAAAEQLQQLARTLKQTVAAENQATTTRLLVQLQDAIELQASILNSVKALVETQERNAESVETLKANAKATAGKQQSVAERIRQLPRESFPSNSFAWLADRTEQTMLKSTAAIERLRLDPEAMMAADSAHRQLVVLLDTLENVASGSSSNPNDPSEDASQSEAGDDERDESGASVEDFKLLRALQAAINEQTAAINSETDSPSKKRKLVELAIEQKAVGQQLLQMLSTDQRSE